MNNFCNYVHNNEKMMKEHIKFHKKVQIDMNYELYSKYYDCRRYDKLIENDK